MIGVWLSPTGTGLVLGVGPGQLQTFGLWCVVRVLWKCGRLPFDIAEDKISYRMWYQYGYSEKDNIQKVLAWLIVLRTTDPSVNQFIEDQRTLDVCFSYLFSGVKLVPTSAFLLLLFFFNLAFSAYLKNKTPKHPLAPPLLPPPPPQENKISLFI